MEWPALFPKLNSLDFLLWRHLQTEVYRTPSANLEELKEIISLEYQSIIRFIMERLETFVGHIIALIIAANHLTECHHVGCEYLDQSSVSQHCTQNITYLHIQLNPREIYIVCKKPDILEYQDILSFNLKYLKIISNEASHSLSTLVNRCYHSKSKSIKYEIDLNNLEIISIPESILEESNSVEYLRIENKMKSKEVISPVVRLQSKFLVHGGQLQTLIINDLEVSKLHLYFQSLSRIKTINLNSNNIEVIEDSIFTNLSTLTSLTLHNNRIKVLSDKSFTGLSGMKSLILSSNELTHLKKDWFHHIYNLKFLNLSDNKMITIERNTFSLLFQLESLDLSNNPNIILQEDMLSNVSLLKSVNLSGCNLGDMSTTFFQGSQNIEVLNISHNPSMKIPFDYFKNLTHLKILDLSFNNMSYMSHSLLWPLKYLTSLHLESNKLTELDLTQFRGISSLQIIDLSNNFITKFSNISETFRVRKIVLKNNLINTFHSFFLRIVDIQYINLSGNRIVSVMLEKQTISKKHELVIDLSNNSICNVNISELQIEDKKNSDQNWKAMINLSQNNVQCNCHHYQIDEKLDVGSRILLLQLSNKDDLCFELYPNYFCPMVYIRNCPEECSCFYTRIENAIHLDCSYRNLTTFPQIQNLETNKYVHKQIFVNLNNNNLDKDGQELMEYYDNVTKLDLSSNLMQHVKWLPPKLKELNLENNRLTVLSREIVDKLRTNKKLKKISFRYNPWECNCEIVDLLQYVIQFNTLKVNQTGYICNITDEALLYTSLCKNENTIKVVLSISVAVVMATILLVLTLYYKYETSIKIYLYSKNICLCCVAEEDIDKDKTYDVFISYSHKDGEFVHSEILPELESGEPPFKVCIHYREFMPGEFISTQIINAVLNSRRTLVILSNNFMESVWGKMEFRTAHTQAISEGFARVIVILYGDLDEDTLDDEIKIYLKTNTYVKWGDPWFWSKLKYALPHSNPKKKANLHPSQELIHLK